MSDFQFPDYSKGFAQDAASPFDWIKGFAQSTLESIPEVVGISPSFDTQTWRQDNPWSAVGSEVLGMAVPYGGWLKASTKIPKLVSAIDKVGDVAKSPFLTGALQETVRLAPFEVGRVAVSQVIGDKSLEQMTGEAVFNLGLTAGVGGILRGVASAGIRDPKLEAIFPGLDISAPLPLMARKMREVVNSGTLQGEALDRATLKLNKTLDLARTEEIPGDLRYIAPLEQAYGDVDRQLNRLFKVKTQPDQRVLQVRKFAHGVEKDFPDPARWQAEAQAAGLPADFVELGQFFRSVSFNPAKPQAAQIARTIDTQLTTKMTSVGDGLFLAREADEGMFVMAKKYQGQPGKAEPTDKWVVFKTDRPGAFATEADKWAGLQVAKGKWVPGSELAADGGDVYNVTKGYIEQMPLRNYRALADKPSKIGETISKLVPDNIRGNEAIARMGEAFKEYLAPRAHQFKTDFRSNWIVNGFKVAYDHAETMTQMLMHGKASVDQSKSLFFSALAGRTESGYGNFLPVRGMVQALSDDDLKAFWQHVWRPGRKAAELGELQAQGVISPEVRAFAENLEAIDKFNIGNMNKAEEAVGRRPSKWREGHYGLSRNWEGDTRYVVNDDAGNLVAVAGGPNRKAARANAEALVKENPGWRIGYEYDVSRDELPKALLPTVKSPSFLLERQDIRGFKWDTQAFTKQEFLEAYENALRGRQRYQANLTVDDMFGPQLERLSVDNPAAYRQVVARKNDYAGVQSTFGRWQNKMADQVLGPALGTNSATKIVGVTNTALFNLQLGALKLSYPIVNALQFIQTVMPEVAFVLGKAPADVLAGKYSHFAAGGEKGPVTGMAVLSPLKMMRDSFVEMRKPGKELLSAFERAVNERVVDPRVVEDYVGEAAAKVSDWRKVLKGEAGFGSWLRAVSEFLPAETERLSRTHAFTVGHGLARDFLHAGGRPLSEEARYQFAKQFTEYTMYMYAASDKPRIFTTPAGSLFGLFKNWMFNYTATMGEYAAEGFTRNNWAPLVWQTAGTFALGGVAATPLWWAADAASKFMTNKSLMVNLYDEYGERADGVMLGLPAALTGVSLYSQVNAPGSNPMRDASQIFSIMAWDRMKAIGKVAGAAVDAYQATGRHPADTKGVREALAQAFAPTTLYRAMGAFDREGMITSTRTGLPIVRNMSGVDKFLYSTGFNPVELDRAQAVSQEIHSSREKYKGQVQKLGQAWADAQREGNSQALALIMRQAMTWGVDVSSVIKSGMTRVRDEERTAAERLVRPRDVQTYMQLLEMGR